MSGCLATLCGLLLMGRAQAGTVDPAQVWTSGSVQYTWVPTLDYGYVAMSDGVPVNGITFGFNPLLDEDEARSLEPVVRVAILADEGEPPVVTPEPATWGAAAVGLMALCVYRWRIA